MDSNNMITPPRPGTFIAAKRPQKKVSRNMPQLTLLMHAFLMQRSFP